jgi:hypothetical protein
MSVKTGFGLDGRSTRSHQTLQKTHTQNPSTGLEPWTPPYHGDQGVCAWLSGSSLCLQIRRYGHRDDSRKTPGVKIVSVNCQSFLLLHEWFRRVEEKSRCGSACPKQAVIGTP